MGKTYRETFDDGPGGWWAWISNSQGPKPLELRDGAVTTRSPWWIDYNHAPPGAGYLHMLACLNTTGPQGEHFRETAGPNQFVEASFPTDFAGAALELTLKGELSAQGARLLLLIQGTLDGITSPWVLTGQPFQVTEDWSTQCVTLSEDPDQWTALGSRHDRADMYGIHPIKTLLRHVNNNIMLVLFPLEIAPMGPLEGDLHQLRPEKDYPVWRHRLPEGYVTVDDVTIAFAD